MMSKFVSRARPGAARAAVSGPAMSRCDKAGEVIRGFVSALERCEAALARPVRRRGRRAGAASLHQPTT